MTDAVLSALEGRIWPTTRDVAERLAWPIPRAAAVLGQLLRDGRVERFVVVLGNRRVACWSWSLTEELRHMGVL